MWQKFGERGRNRTFNLLIKSQLLCQLSYAPTCKGRNFQREFNYNKAAARIALFSDAQRNFTDRFIRCESPMRVRDPLERKLAVDRHV